MLLRGVGMTYGYYPLTWIRLSLSAFAALGSWLAALFRYMRSRLAVLAMLAAHRTNRLLDRRKAAYPRVKLGEA